MERDSQMLAMLLQEAASRDIYVEPRSLAVAKRGVCTFVQKATALQNGGANLALIVNNGKHLFLLAVCFNSLLIFGRHFVAMTGLIFLDW